MKCLWLFSLLLLTNCQNAENKMAAVADASPNQDTIPYLATKEDSGIVYRIIASEILDSVEPDSLNIHRTNICHTMKS